MKHNFKHVNVWQTSKVLVLTEAFIFSLFFLIVFVPSIVIALVMGDIEIFGFAFSSLGAFILYLLALALFRFLMLVFYSWAYNFVSKRVGGIEIEVEHKE